MIERAFSLLGIFVILGIGVLMSSSRRKIPWRLVSVGIGLQAYLAIFIVRTDWVPVVLTISAAACAALIFNGLFRGREWGLPLARGLGLLGVATLLLSVAVPAIGWWGLLLPIPLAFLRGRIAGAIALVGCVAVASGVWFGLIPEDFVFQGVDGVAGGVKWVIGYAHRGVEPLFGPIMGLEGFIFVIEVGAIILLFGGLMAILYHLGVIPWMVGWMARLLHRALGVSGAESLAAASNVFAGQTEAPLIIRPYLPRMTRSEIMALMTGGFATIAGSVLGAYILMLTRAGLERGASDLIAASLMSAPAAFVFAKMVVPETEVAETRDSANLKHEPIGTNLLDSLSGGVTAALKLAVNVMAMLLVFYALIFMLNDVVEFVAREVFGKQDVTFQGLYAWIFRPFAALIGVEWRDTLLVGELLGTKTIFNEFIAYDRLGGLIKEGAIGTRSAVLATYALCGFANFMSIGIQIAGLSQLAPGKRPVFSGLALRAMVAGALACQLTACIVGLIGKF